jgi:hypothetical protein
MLRQNIHRISDYFSVAQYECASLPLQAESASQAQFLRYHRLDLFVVGADASSVQLTSAARAAARMTVTMQTGELECLATLQYRKRSAVITMPF